MPPKLDPQLALDEQAITNAELEAVLERRLRIKDDIAELRGTLKTATDEVNAHLVEIPFPVDSALRVGRFRITKNRVEGRTVSFETEAREQIRIGLVDEDGAPPKAAKGTGGFGRKPKSVSDDEDLRPKGEVNPDALRGEADRATLPN